MLTSVTVHISGSTQRNNLRSRQMRAITDANGRLYVALDGRWWKLSHAAQGNGTIPMGWRSINSCDPAQHETLCNIALAAGYYADRHAPVAPVAPIA